MSSEHLRQLQLFAWRAERQFLFIATSGGAYDLVKNQPVSDQTLVSLRREYEKLLDLAGRQRKWNALPHSTRASTNLLQGIRALGDLIARIVLHPDIRHVLQDSSLAEVMISTNEFSIPWELMAAGDSFLALRCPVTRRIQSSRPMTPGARVVFRNTLKVLLAHNPTGDLPSTDTEADEIKKLLEHNASRFEVLCVRGEDCTRFNLLSLIAEADIFHYAGHAYFDPERPEQSGLLLHDGPLWASELENYLDNTAPLLVFLNACESGAFGSSSSLLAGQDMASLAHPFIACGCAAFIGSSLPVGDVQAAYFATTVYEHLTLGSPISISTWRARNTVKDRFGLADSTWSSFLLFGDGGLRVVLTENGHNIDSAAVRRVMCEAALWLLSERADTGHWCDRVYRQQAPMNSAEVTLALRETGVSMPKEAYLQTLDCLLGAKEEGYSAAPYEPASLGTFTSCVSYVLKALLVFLEEERCVGGEGEARASIEGAIIEAEATLLRLQEPDGGWGWGEIQVGVGPYTLFTVEALDGLQAAYEVSRSERVAAAIAKGYEYLKRAQRQDGGWGYRDGADTSDVTNTCYAVCQLLSSGMPADSPLVVSGLSYLRENLDFANLTDSAFFIDHRIEAVNLPRNEWPHFEDYGGLAALCQLLTLAPAVEKHLETSGLQPSLLRRMLADQEPGRGWPRTYSTIYVTNFYIAVLALIAEALERQEN